VATTWRKVEVHTDYIRKMWKVEISLGIFWYSNAGDTLVVNYTELCYGGDFCKHTANMRGQQKRGVFFRRRVMSTLGKHHIR